LVGRSGSGAIKRARSPSLSCRPSANPRAIALVFLPALTILVLSFYAVLGLNVALLQGDEYMMVVPVGLILGII
jgi:hypothetical protein